MRQEAGLSLELTTLSLDKAADKLKCITGRPHDHCEFFKRVVPKGLDHTLSVDLITISLYVYVVLEIFFGKSK